jgi:hypothetical protein
MHIIKLDTEDFLCLYSSLKQRYCSKLKFVEVGGEKRFFVFVGGSSPSPTKGREGKSFFSEVGKKSSLLHKPPSLGTDDR